MIIILSCYNKYNKVILGPCTGVCWSLMLWPAVMLAGKMTTCPKGSGSFLWKPPQRSEGPCWCRMRLSGKRGGFSLLTAWWGASRHKCPQPSITVPWEARGLDLLASCSYYRKPLLISIHINSLKKKNIFKNRFATPRKIHKRIKNRDSDTYVRVSTAVLSQWPRCWKHPKCPWTDGWIHTTWSVMCTWEYYSAMKRSGALTHAQCG